MSLALYREFRPKNFDEIVGQDYIIQTLKNQIKTDRLLHAYLFTGPRGTGKTSTAKIFAKAVNCTHTEDGNPCGKCAECVALNEANTDIVEIDAASNNRVEEIRDLREKVSFPPMIGKYKVYIVDEVHMLTDSAFNALLKTLEEPPKHVIFILATTEIHKLPATILSRCARFDFKLLTINTLVNHLKSIFDKKGIKYDEKSLHLIAKAGQGSDRDMLSVADSVASFCNYDITFDKAEDVIGLSDRDGIRNVLKAVKDKDVLALFNAIHGAIGRGKNVQVLCREMADFIKDLIMVKSGVNDYAVLDILPGEYAGYVEMSEGFDIGLLKRAFSKFASIELDLKYSLNPENLFESACLELIDSPSGEMNFERKLEVQVEKSLPKVDDRPQTETERVWGNVLLKVKEKNLFAISHALLSVNKVDRVGNKLVLTTNDSGTYELIDNTDKINILLDIVKLFDDSIELLSIEYDGSSASDKDIKNNLKEVFKDRIKFKN